MLARWAIGSRTSRAFPASNSMHAVGIGNVCVVAVLITSSIPAHSTPQTLLPNRLRTELRPKHDSTSVALLGTVGTSATVAALESSVSGTALGKTFSNARVLVKSGCVDRTSQARA